MLRAQFISSDHRTASLIPNLIISDWGLALPKANVEA